MKIDYYSYKERSNIVSDPKQFQSGQLSKD